MRIFIIMFQFPSNGNADPKQAESAKTAGWSRFQFPSNGKADCKDMWQIFKVTPIIEFQFPSNGKADRKESIRLARAIKRFVFNSLQTGKRIQSIKERSMLRVSESFNSLQTGTRIQRAAFSMVLASTTLVSIPFKRERGSQDLSRLHRHKMAITFQFPSNGNAYRKLAH